MDDRLQDKKLMKEAKKRVKTKQHLRFQAVLFACVSVVLLVVYFVGGNSSDEAGFFWPLIPIVGMAFALLIQFIIFFPDMFGNKRRTDEAIQKEFQRLKDES